MLLLAGGPGGGGEEGLANATTKPRDDGVDADDQAEGRAEVRAGSSGDDGCGGGTSKHLRPLAGEPFRGSRSAGTEARQTDRRPIAKDGRPWAGAAGGGEMLRRGLVRCGPRCVRGTVAVKTLLYVMGSGSAKRRKEKRKRWRKRLCGLRSRPALQKYRVKVGEATEDQVYIARTTTNYIEQAA